MSSSESGGFALLLTIIALLIFAFFAFMGLEYLCEGDHQKVLLCCIPAVLVLGFFIWLAQRIKHGRKKNVALEVSSLLAALCIVVLGMIPFSQFVYTIEHEQDANQLVLDARDAARDIDSLYHSYASQRVADYSNHLKKDESRLTKVESLKRRLYPSNKETVAMERAMWLDLLQNIDLWNVATARNLHYIITASDEWTRQYSKVSEIIYEGEQCEPFEIDNSDIRARYSQFTTFQWPITTWSIIAGLTCCVLMFVSYIVCTRSRNKYMGHRA